MFAIQRVLNDIPSAHATLSERMLEVLSALHSVDDDVCPFVAGVLGALAAGCDPYGYSATAVTVIGDAMFEGHGDPAQVITHVLKVRVHSEREYTAWVAAHAVAPAWSVVFFIPDEEWAYRDTVPTEEIFERALWCVRQTPPPQDLGAPAPGGNGNGKG